MDARGGDLIVKSALRTAHCVFAGPGGQMMARLFKNRCHNRLTKRPGRELLAGLILSLALPWNRGTMVEHEVKRWSTTTIV
jgi:hypothetical protein